MKKKGPYILFAGILLLCLQWYVITFFRIPAGHLASTIFAGICIFASAFVLSWAADLAQFYMPQAMAMTFLALVAVLPEYAVDMYFAWTAGKDPAYISYACANMTGGNRLLIGFGWALIIFVSWFKSRKTYVEFDENFKIEIGVLLAATIYSFIVPMKSSLTLIDTFVLISIFVYYISRISKLGIQEPELDDSPVEFLAKLPNLTRGAVTLLLFAFAAFSIYISTKPFAEGLLAIGANMGIDQFILVQWVAPLVSESPELVTAVIFVLKSQTAASFRIVISSKINQWTLLVGMLPLIYNLSLGKVKAMPLDPRQTEELLLTSAQSFFAIVLIKNLRFSLLEGSVLFALFISQVFFPSTKIRLLFAAFYIALSACLLLRRKLQK